MIFHHRVLCEVEVNLDLNPSVHLASVVVPPWSLRRPAGVTRCRLLYHHLVAWVRVHRCSCRQRRLASFLVIACRLRRWTASCLVARRSPWKEVKKGKQALLTKTAQL